MSSESQLLKNTIPSTYERRKNQTAKLDIINQDLISQTEKIQFLSKDINNIQEKVRHTREISKEYKKILKENDYLKNEINKMSKIFEKFEAENQKLQDLNKQQQARIDELEYHARKNGEIADERRANVESLKSKMEQIQRQDYQEKQIHVAENQKLKAEITSLRNILEQKSNQLISISKEFEGLRIANSETQGELKRVFSLKRDNERDAREFYTEMVRYKEMYEEQKAKNNILSRDIEENLVLFVAVNEDYQRTMVKLQELEASCVEQVKINNRLMDQINYEEVINYKGSGMVY